MSAEAEHLMDEGAVEESPADTSAAQGLRKLRSQVTFKAAVCGGCIFLLVLVGSVLGIMIATFIKPEVTYEKFTITTPLTASQKPAPTGKETLSMTGELNLHLSVLNPNSYPSELNVQGLEVELQYDENKYKDGEDTVVKLGSDRPVIARAHLAEELKVVPKKEAELVVAVPIHLPPKEDDIVLDPTAQKLMYLGCAQRNKLPLIALVHNARAGLFGSPVEIPMIHAHFEVECTDIAKGAVQGVANNPTGGITVESAGGKVAEEEAAAKQEAPASQEAAKKTAKEAPAALAQVGHSFLDVRRARATVPVSPHK